MENPDAGVIFPKQRRLVIVILLLLVFLPTFSFSLDLNYETLVSAEQIVNENSPAFYLQPGFYFLSMPGIIFFIVILLSRKLGAKKSVVIIIFTSVLSFLNSTETLDRSALENAYQYFDDHQYLEASEGFLSCLSLYPYSKSLKLNIAISLFKADKLGQAVGYLHRVLKMDPLDYWANKYLSVWEKDYNFLAMKKLIPSIRIDFIFWILIGVINLIFIFAGIQYLKRQGIWMILLITSIAIFLIMAFVFALSLGQTYEKVAVLVAEEGDLKRIPIKDASSWITLREGTVFRVLGQEEDLVLVETDLDLKGWIEENLLEIF